jgi:hypothetical protein
MLQRRTKAAGLRPQGLGDTTKDKTMSTQTLNANGSFSTGEVRNGGFLQAVRTFFDAVGDSLAAAHEYKRLVAAGVEPSQAARRVFETKIDKR